MDQHHIQESPAISEWLKQQPLSILQLDAADRIVLFIAGMCAPSALFAARPALLSCVSSRLYGVQWTVVWQSV